MRRLLTILAVLSLVVPATAQMRGGGMRTGGFAGGGFRGGFVGARSGFVPSRAGVFGSHGPIIRTVPPFGGFGFGFHHRRFGRFRNGGFLPCRAGVCSNFGFGFGSPFFGGFGFGAPLFIGDYDSFEGTAYAPNVRQYDDTRDREVNELIMQLRDQQRELDYLINNMQRGPEYEGPPPPQQQQPPQQNAPQNRNQRPQARPQGANAAPAQPSNQPATTLVFKDGHRMDVQNYVIAKGTLTVLDGGRRQHIALSQLDLPATQKVNDDKGVPFKAPTVSVSLLCNPADPDFSCRPHTARPAETGAANALRP